MSETEREFEDRMVARGMEIVRPLIAESGRIVRRAEAMYRDMTGATTPLHSADMAEVDRQWWYRMAKISIDQESGTDG